MSLFVSNMLSLDGSKLLPVCICLSMRMTWWMDCCCRFDLECAFAFLISRTWLMILCIYLFNFYHAVDGFWLRCSGSGIGSVSLIVSNKLTLDGSKLLPCAFAC